MCMGTGVHTYTGVGVHVGVKCNNVYGVHDTYAPYGYSINLPIMQLDASCITCFTPSGTMLCLCHITH